MFRKISKTGPASLTISLPVKWVKKHNLKQGEFLEVKEANNKLIISSDIGEKTETIKIKYNEILIENMLEKLFLESKSTIIIESETKIPKTIIHLVNQFPGFKITELSNKKAVINRVLKPTLNKPQALLRRNYFVLKEALTHNPPKFSSDLLDNIFLLQLLQERPKEIFIIKELYNVLQNIKNPIYDDAYALFKLLFNKIYLQKYKFSSEDTKKILNILSKTEELFKEYFKKTKRPLQISQIYYCVQLLNQLHKEIIYKQSITELSKSNEMKTKKFKVGVCLKNQSNQFWAGDVKESMEKTSLENKNIEFIFNSPLTDFNVKSQEKILNKFISKKVDGIILAPVIPKTMKKTIRKINKLKIPLLILDTDIELEEMKYTFIGFDNFKGGKITGNYMKKFIKEGSHILILKGHLKGNFEERVTGFKTAMGNKYKFSTKIGEFQESVSFEKTLSFVKKNKIDAIFATSDNMAIGAIKAMEKLGRKIPVSAFDWTEEGKRIMQEGEIISDVNSKPKKMGVLAVQTMNDLLNKKIVANRIEYDIEFIKQSSKKVT